MCFFVFCINYIRKSVRQSFAQTTNYKAYSITSRLWTRWEQKYSVLIKENIINPYIIIVQFL